MIRPAARPDQLDGFATPADSVFMAALTTSVSVLGLLPAGDHVIGQATCGGTVSVLLSLLPRPGISTTVVDQRDPRRSNGR